MSIDLARLGSLMSLTYDSGNRQLYGQIMGLNCYVQYFKNDGMLALRFFAVTDSEGVRKRLMDLCAANAEFTFLRVGNNRLTGNLFLPDGCNEEFAANKIMALAAFAKENGFVTCCSCCGAVGVPQMYYRLVNETVCLCEPCSHLVASDVERTNQMLESKKPHITGTVIGAVLGALLLFGMNLWLGSGLQPLLSFILDGITGTALCIFLAKKLGKRASLLGAVLSIAFCMLALAVGSVGAEARYFADFNKKHAPEEQYIISYYESIQQGHDVVAEAMYSGDSELMQEYYSLSDMSGEKLRDRYKAAKRIDDNQTTWDCIKNFPDLLFSSYGDKVRTPFIESVISGLVSTLIIGFILWRWFIKMDRVKFRYTPLSTAIQNPYDLFMGKQGGTP